MGTDAFTVSEALEEDDDEDIVDIERPGFASFPMLLRQAQRGALDPAIAVTWVEALRPRLDEARAFIAQTRIPTELGPRAQAQAQAALQSTADAVATLDQALDLVEAFVADGDPALAGEAIALLAGVQGFVRSM